MGLMGAGIQVVPAYLPVDVNGATPTGDRVDMKLYDKLTFMGINADGTGAITYTLQEHTAATGGTSANLVVIQTYYEKTAAAVFTATGSFAKNSQAAVATVATTADQPSVIVFEVRAADMSAGFQWLSVNATETMAAECFVGAFYILSGCRHGQKVTPGALA